jgi:hypothetical protein
MKIGAADDGNARARTMAMPSETMAMRWSWTMRAMQIVAKTTNAPVIKGTYVEGFVTMDMINSVYREGNI